VEDMSTGGHYRSIAYPGRVDGQYVLLEAHGAISLVSHQHPSVPSSEILASSIVQQLDHPFIYTIVSKLGEVLFAGVVRGD